MRVFEAQYHGHCEGCHGHISPGDDVAYEGPDVLHARCVEDGPPSTTPPTRPVIVCSTCWMTKPCECGS